VSDTILISPPGMAAIAVISAPALRHNLARVRASAPGCPVMAVVKARAYGHGISEVAGLLDDADAFAVARLDEARELRAIDVTRPIVLLGGLYSADELDAACRARLTPVVHSRAQVELLEAAAPGPALDVWLKTDTGMGRLGVPPEEVAELAARLRACPRVASEPDLMTHLASADDPGDPATGEQLAAFRRIADGWAGDISIANSAAILGWPELLGAGKEFGCAGQNWVRPGLMLYGASPLAGRGASDCGLLPVMSFETRLIDVKSIGAGRRVGYGGDWRSARDSRIGIAAVGYADGYPRHLGSGTPVGIRGRLAPLAGRVSMDLIAVDVTDIPEAATGDRVVLWGEAPGVDEIAARAGTIAYELLAGVGRRVHRRVAGVSP